MYIYCTCTQNRCPSDVEGWLLTSIAPSEIVPHAFRSVERRRQVPYRTVRNRGGALRRNTATAHRESEFTRKANQQKCTPNRGESTIPSLPLPDTARLVRGREGGIVLLYNTTCLLFDLCYSTTTTTTTGHFALTEEVLERW